MNYRRKRKAAMGFYVCAGLCLVAIGIAALVSYSSVVTTPMSNNDTASQTSKQEDIKIESQVNKENVNTENKKNNDANKVTKEEISPTPANKKEDEKEESSKEEKEDEEPASTVPQAVVANISHFVFPAKANVIKSYSGDAPIYSETMRDFRVHNAVDYESELGGKILAISDGTVKDIYKDAMYGNVIEITHGNYNVLYCGMADNFNVSVGDNVTIGEEIGTLGEIPCEIMDAPHLHLEIFENEKAVNAESIIPK